MEFEFLDPVDVLQLWPKEQRALLKEPKWTDRRDSLQSLLDLIEKHPRLREDADYGELVKQLKWIIQQDSNVNVAALAVRVLTGFARGLPGVAFERFAVDVAPAIFDKFKEKKAQLREPLAECADALAKTCNIEKLVPAMQDALKKPNPQVKILLDFFVFRTLNDYDTPPMGFLKAVLPIVAKHAEDGDPEVRDSACAAIGAAHRLIGAPGVGQFASAVLSDKNKAAKVSEYLEKAKADAEERRKSRAETRPVNGSEGTAEPNGATAADDTQQQQEAAAIDPWELLEPVDVVAKLSENFQEKLQSKSWQERKEALENLLDLLEKNPRLVADASLYKESVTAIAKVLEKDVNINVCAVAAKCEKGFALGLRQNFAALATAVIPVCVEKFKEKKPVLREPLVECIDAIALTTPLSSYVDTVVAGLGKPNPAVKQQTAMFVARLLRKHNSATVPVEAVKELAPKLDKVASDPDPDVRDAAFAAIGSIMRCIGEPAATRLFTETMADTIKAAKVAEEWKKAVEDCGQNAAPEAMKLAAARGAANGKVAPAASTPVQAATQRSSARPAPRVSSAARPKSTLTAKPPTPKAPPKVTVNVVRKEKVENGAHAGKATPSAPALPVQKPVLGTPVARPRRSLLTPSRDALSTAARGRYDSTASATSNGSASNGTTVQRRGASEATPRSALRPPPAPLSTRKDHSVPRSYSSTQMRSYQPRAPSAGRPSSQASISHPSNARRTLTATERPPSALDLVCAGMDSIFADTSNKQHRYEAEQAGKVFRWKFFIPTPSHESQLRQLFTANTPPDFVDLLFSENFRCHNRAIDIFAHVLEVNPENVLANIDLVLKWLSLRLLENNTQTLGKAFNLISAMLAKLLESCRRLAENEAEFFVPFVVQKLSDTKLIVSTGTVKVLDALPSHLPLTSVILHLAEGLKTKNRRQQNACLGLIQKMLRDNPTLARYQSGQPLFLTRLVQPITAVLGDCDPPTRQEALDTLLAVWTQIGDKIDLYVRTLSQDDTAALDELRRQKGSRLPAPTSHIPILSSGTLPGTVMPGGDGI